MHFAYLPVLSCKIGCSTNNVFNLCYFFITQVILDLIPYENIVVKRALNFDKSFLEKLGITSVPSCYLMHPNGSHGLVNR